MAVTKLKTKRELVWKEMAIRNGQVDNRRIVRCAVPHRFSTLMTIKCVSGPGRVKTLVSSKTFCSDIQHRKSNQIDLLVGFYSLWNVPIRPQLKRRGGEAL
ncbi:hypothetical protein O181_066262 [Austropuccinia psidii MF-1]|uniref:Uncharacterized protein n=1 Tax=Austropuccinia psidii MF-1 TaxID=1389203 RepID=A0A9Q3EYU3_9BASI|nr:hypothetical protein [Austropuccinia psidii MF-1]